MKHIIIKNIEITGFKGISHLILTLDGQSAVIAGRNGTGKTSVYDAVLWLFFGKVSNGSKSDVKPVDAEGKRKSGADCEVSAVLSVDGVDVTLRRQWHELWRKPVGGGDEIYDRDQTLCWINDVPKALEKEYTPFVLSMLGDNEDVFRLITDHGAFMRLHWTERRKQLIAIAGGDPDAELHSMPEFAEIADILSGDTTEDAKKRLQGQHKRLTDQLNQIPVRMDELDKTMEPVSTSEITAAQTEIARINGEIAAVDAELTDTQGAVDAMNALLRQKSEAARTVADIAARAAVEKDEAVRVLARQCGQMEAERANLCDKALDYERQAEREEANAKQLNASRQSLLDSYHALMDEKYQAPELSSICPTCGQALPVEQVESARQKHADEWATQKRAKADMLVGKGKGIRASAEQAEARAEDARTAARTLRTRAGEMEAPIKALAEQEATKRAETINLETLPDYASAKALLDETNAQIEVFGTDTRRQELSVQKADLTRSLDAPRTVLSRAEQSRKVQERIKELQAEKKRLGTQIVEVDGKLDLLGRYVRAYCSAMEDSINAHFRTIRWKLFDIAKNGTVQDCCDATVNGVPYGDGLNNGARINAGIEIISVLSRAYGVSAPCFVDNAEAVNTLTRTAGQMIELRVSNDPVLIVTLYPDDPTMQQAV